MSNPVLREWVLGWDRTALRWSIVALTEDDCWHFRDTPDLVVKRSAVGPWIELPDASRSLCDVSELDQARAAGVGEQS